MEDTCRIVKILFCDDNVQILHQLERYVTDYFRKLGGAMPALASYTSGDMLLQQETVADIAFLDVEMPGVQGIRVGALLKERNPRIKIFIVTAYDDYLDEAMRFQVFRYLSKPIDKNRLYRNLKDALCQYNMETTLYPIKTTNALITQNAEDILCIEALQGHVTVHTTQGSLQSVDTMPYWRKTLTLPCFYATHRSFIVNMRYVRCIKADVVLLQYQQTQITAYLARRNRAAFENTYLLYLENIK